MTDFTRKRKYLSGLRHLLDLLDNMISAKADNESRRRGHTVTRKPGTRTHVYRDPRWDERRAQLMNDIDDARSVAGESHWGRVVMRELTSESVSQGDRERLPAAPEGES